MIIDNFYTNPDSVREYALTQEFNVKGNYPGLRTKPYLPQDVKDAIGYWMQFAGNVTSWFEESEYTGAFQIATAQDRTWIHADHYNMWAGVCYLTPDAPHTAGTALYRHKQSGEFYRTNKEYETATEIQRIRAENTYKKEQIGNENIALLMHARSNDKIILVSNFGKFYTIEADNILTGSSTGRPISSYLTLADNEKIIDSFKFDNEGEIFIYTKNGYGFIALEKSLETNKKTGKKVMNIKGDDTVVGISKVLKDADSAIIICDADGKNKMLAFNINEIPKLDKGRGVILVKGKSLKVVSATIFNSKSVIKDQIDKTLFDKSTIEDNYGKRAQSGKVIKNYKNQIMNRNFENNIRCHL